MRSQTVISVLVLLIITSILGYLLIGSMTEPAHEPVAKSAESYEAPTTELNAQKYLNAKTEVLGHAVYDSAENVLGTLYDVYASPKDGKIEWLSINIADMTTDRPDAELILVPYMRVEEMDNTLPVILNITKPEFFEFPFQQQDEKRLEDLVSLRALPATVITDARGADLGYVDSVTYKNGYLDKVHFFASDNYLTPSQREKFSIPFSHLEHNVTGEIGSEIRLTERQEGAIEMYLKNKDTAP